MSRRGGLGTIAPLGEVCHIQIGRTPSRDEPRFWGAGSPWVSIRDMNGEKVLTTTKEEITPAGIQASRSKLIAAGTVLMSFKLSIGKVAIAGTPLYTNEAIAALRPIDPDRLLPDYLFHYLRQADVARGSDRAVMGSTLNKEKLHTIPIRLPPAAEQRRVATILDIADSIRHKRARAAEMLQDLVRGTFLDWFGDPVTNPQGWPMKPLEQVLERVDYGTARACSVEPIGMPILRMNNLTETGSVDLSAMKFCRLSAEQETALTLLKGDVLFNRTNSPALVGKVAEWRADGRYGFAGYLIRLRPNAKELLPAYLATALNARSMKSRIRGAAKPSGNQANFSAGMVKELLLPIPPLTTQRAFTRWRNSVEAMKDRLTRASVAADMLAHSLEKAYFG